MKIPRLSAFTPCCYAHTEEVSTPPNVVDSDIRGRWYQIDTFTERIEV